MTFFVRAVVSGFALSLGSALFKKVQRQLGLADDKDKEKDAEKGKKEPDAVRQEGQLDPGLET